MSKEKIKQREINKIFSPKTKKGVSVYAILCIVAILVSIQLYTYRDYFFNSIQKLGESPTRDLPVMIDLKSFNLHEPGEIHYVSIEGNSTKVTLDSILNPDINYYIMHNNDILSENDIISNGDILKIDGGQEYVLIVIGDLNKDGMVNIYDINKLHAFLMNSNNEVLDKEQQLAADVDMDRREINMDDFIVLKDSVLDQVEV